MYRKQEGKVDKDGRLYSDFKLAFGLICALSKSRPQDSALS